MAGTHILATSEFYGAPSMHVSHGDPSVPSFWGPREESSPGTETADAERASLKDELVSAIGEDAWSYWIGNPLAAYRAGEVTGDIHTLADSFAVPVDDVRAWYRLYGGWWTVALVLFGRKSVWKMQARVLGRMPRRDPEGDPRRGPIGDPRRGAASNPRRGPGGDSGGDPGGGPGGDDPYDSGDEFGDESVGSSGCGEGRYAEEEYSRLVEGESTRIGVSGSIIASVIATALAFDTLSQTHWVARAAWVYSLASSLMAVYCANNLSWKMGYLVLGGKLRTWISGYRGDPRSRFLLALRAPEEEKQTARDQLLASLIPAPVSTLAVSAPAILLSSSLLFLFVGFGIFFGFIWERALDVSAGPNDSRDVFGVYMVSLGVCGFLLASSTTVSHDRTASSTVRGTVGRNIKQAAACKKLVGETVQQEMMKSLVDGQNKILSFLVANREMMEIAKIKHDFEDHTGQTPLHWAAQKGSRLSVLRLLSHGADCNHTDRHGWTPLMMAAANNQEDIARDLLHAGANLSLKNEDGKTAWDIATERGYDGFRFLLEGP